VRELDAYACNPNAPAVCKVGSVSVVVACQFAGSVVPTFQTFPDSVAVPVPDTLARNRRCRRPDRSGRTRAE